MSGLPTAHAAHSAADPITPRPAAHIQSAIHNDGVAPVLVTDGNAVSVK
jgi:hypothetical protein